ncbi:ATP binding protein [Handroanthus impetiginosus]|uniref:ATP binding protein n=1 Tax=Handroanthus impetiginosus TaxID=429701 RepID=A0A2G9GND1_9LAMI|nr:ATP binding protein [Handroanthus impetiginosus]
MDDAELEKLHAERIAALKKEAEKRQELKMQVICHFYHREFHCCKIMDKHLKALASRHFTTKFIKLEAEVSVEEYPAYIYTAEKVIDSREAKLFLVFWQNAPFFVTKLGIKTLPCVILFRKGVAADRLVGFQDLGGKDDFSTRTLEIFLLKKGIIDENKLEVEDDDYLEGKRRTVRSSVNPDSDSD